MTQSRSPDGRQGRTPLSPRTGNSPLGRSAQPITFFLALSLLIFACENRPASLHRSPASHDTLTLMWYNVENLFDYERSGREYPDYVPDSMGWSYDVYLESLDNISDVIAAAHPDIVGLCEIENETVLKDLIHILRVKGLRLPHYGIGDTPLRSTTHPALLSRVPLRITGTIPVPQPDGNRTRNILECDVRHQSGLLKVFANHWPSKAHPERSRIAAARVLRQRLDELPPDCDYIVMGDFNENHNEHETIHIDTDCGVDCQTALGRVLGTTRRADNGRDCPVTRKHIIFDSFHEKLYNPWWDVAEYRRWNYVYRRRRQTPDHILLPHSLFDTVGLSYVDGSFSVFRWSGRLLFDGVPYRKQRRWYKGARYHTGEGYSDHLPLLVRVFSDAYPDTIATEEIGCESGNDSTIGFESGFEGWIAGEMPFRAKLDTATARSGRRALRVFGIDTRSRTVAKTRLIPGAMGVTEGLSLVLHLRGSGDLSIRFKNGSTGWSYIRPGDPEMVHRSNRYESFQSMQWKRIQIALPPGYRKDDPIDLEIRVKANRPADLWIDDVYRR